MGEPRCRRLLSLVRHRPTHLRHRTIFDGTIKPIRDRGLDHAVEREKHLKPLISLKNLIKNEPSKSLPVSLIKRSNLLPFRPVEFLRKYPSVFDEFLPTAAGGGGGSPHFRLNPETLRLDAEEHLLHQSDLFKHQTADKLSKLLMLSRTHRIPASLVQLLLWDLGLPEDYADTVVPDFPDCFRIADGFLELVCWSHDLAVSVLQNQTLKDGQIAFPVNFSNGFVMDSKYEKWLREWQRLPYVSPYENLSHLSSTSDESDRWVVGVLHEILHVFVGKKIEKESLLELGEWLGLRSRFKRALLQHPGIFYVSSKNGTYTVVLREGYKRGALVEDHPVMNLRNQYVHLMNSVREEGKMGKVVQGKGGVDEVEDKDVGGVEGESEGDGESVEEGDDDGCENDDDDDDDEDEDEKPYGRHGHRNATGRRGREFGKVKLEVDKSGRDSWRERSLLRGSRRERSPLRDFQNERYVGRRGENNSSEFSKRRQVPWRGAHNDLENTQERSHLRGSQRERSPLRDSRNERSVGRTGENNWTEFSKRRPVRGAHNDLENTQERSPLRGSRRERSPLRDSRNERSVGRTGEKNNSSEFSKRRHVRGTYNDHENTQGRSRSSESSRRSFNTKKTPAL